MNMRRIALAAIAAWVVWMALGFIINGYLLADYYQQNAGAMRPDAEMMPKLPLGFGLGLVGFFVLAYMYGKGYEGGSGVQEGLRFGVLVSLLLICLSVVWNYIVFPISGTLTFIWIVTTLVVFAIYGMIIGAIYRPTSTAATRAPL